MPGRDSNTSTQVFLCWNVDSDSYDAQSSQIWNQKIIMS